MGTIVKSNLACLNPECGSSDARRLYADGTSFCFSCKGFFGKDDSDNEVFTAEANKPKKEYKKKDVFEEFQTFAVRGFKERRISKEVAEFYNVRVSYDSNGEIDTHYYPYDGGKALKIRELPKNFKWEGKSTGLFGLELFNGGGKRIIITEGEIDAMAVQQANFAKYNKCYPVVAMSSSVMTKSLLENREKLRSFSEIILCLDADEAGERATEEAIKILGLDKVKIVKLPSGCKDAGEVLLKKGSQELLSCIFDATPYIPPGIITKEALWDRLVIYNNTPSVEYPECLGGLNAKLKGARLGEITLLVSGTSCLGIGTLVLMYDGSTKRAELVQVGDVIMGADSTPREVLSLSRGVDQLYEVSLGDGTSFVCNESHIHTVVNNDTEGRWGLEKDQLVDVTIREYLSWSDKRKHLSKSFKADVLSFEERAPLKLHPYILGVWLGDGYSDSGRLSAHPKSVEIFQKLESLGQPFVKNLTEFSWGLPGLAESLRGVGVLNNKHIPEDYLRASIPERMELLAGLIDTDGCVSVGGYEFSQKSESLIDAFIFLSRSLGFRATKGVQKNNKFGNCFRAWISGPHISEIPVALSYKKIPHKQYRTDQRRFETKIKKLGIGNFYGFEVTGDQRFVLGNFTVTHNCGKSTITREIMLSMKEKTTDGIGIVSLEEAPEETARKLAGMELRRNPAEEDIPLDELKVGFEAVFGGDRFMLLDHQGNLKDESILSKLEYMALSGCKYIIIDHITILVSEGAGDLTGNEAIDKVMNDLLRFVKRHNVWIGLVSHLRKTTNTGKAFEEGRMPNLDDIKGSGSIKQISFDIIAFARNLTETCEIKRNTIDISILKCRYTGLTGPVEGAYYHYETGRFQSLEHSPRPKGEEFELLTQ